MPSQASTAVNADMTAPSAHFRLAVSDIIHEPSPPAWRFFMPALLRALHLPLVHRGMKHLLALLFAVGVFHRIQDLGSFLTQWHRSVLNEWFPSWQSSARSAPRYRAPRP